MITDRSGLDLLLKKKPKWNDDKIVREIIKIKDKIGHFPTQREIRNLYRYDLMGAITRSGGFPKFRLLIGDKLLRKSSCYWTDEIIFQELSKIKVEIGHFPTTRELNNMKQSGLGVAMTTHGGSNKFRKRLGDEIIQVSKGYWSDEIIVKDLTKIKNDIGHFPSQQELSIFNRTNLSNQISIHGGMNRFRKMMGYEPLKVSKGYWIEEKIIEQLTSVKSEIGHFPTHTELQVLGRTGLSSAISKHNGYNFFRNILEDKIIQVPYGFWTDEMIINNLKEIKNSIKHFPTYQELINLGRSDLANAINTNDGINRFRILLGDKILKQPDGYWTEETILEELIEIKTKIGHFPSNQELIDMYRFNLTHAIQRNGGFNKFRELLGESVSLYQKYRSELASYLVKRGKGSETLIKSISQEYCKQNGFTEPKYNVKLSKGHILEIICDVGKTIGIDVTNTSTKYVVTKKWKHKNYHLHLDELWIVVFSDVFIPDDYHRFNEESPTNVKIFSIYQFLKELDYSLDEYTRNKIDKYCSCTFHTKDELKNFENLI